MLIDSVSTHNFIHCKLIKVLSWFVYLTPKFQEIIVDRWIVNFSWKCHNINLTMGEYVLNSPMITIGPMGGADVVWGVQWLQSLGTMDFNFQELFMKFSLESKEFELTGIIGKQSKVISSNGMTKLLKKRTSMCNCTIMLIIRSNI